ncbi:SFI1 protein, partial [Pardalotus punctatus]|nr:SFI1 protein [Pardalotus punctatus]
RCFYNQKILQKAFGEWKEQWTVCRERKLSLRADNHYRHLLLNLIFKAWRAHAWQQEGKRSKYNVTESYAKKQTMRRTWQRWLVYVDVQRIKHGMQSVALAFRERSSLRISWAVWRRQYYQKCTGHKMNILALQHWAQSLQFRAWLQWREVYLYTQNEKLKETRAVIHHQHWELRRCMGAWLGFLNLHRVKKRQNSPENLGQNKPWVICVCLVELAQEFHRSRMLRRCFSEWRLSWECRRRMHAHKRDLGKQAARIALWSVFEHWKHYVVLCVEEARQCQLAEKHYKYHLLVLQKFWNRWKSRL